MHHPAWHRMLPFVTRSPLASEAMPCSCRTLRQLKQRPGWTSPSFSGLADGVAAGYVHLCCVRLPHISRCCARHQATLVRPSHARTQSVPLQVVVNTTVSTVSHLGSKLPSLYELSLNNSMLECLRDLGTGFTQVRIRSARASAQRAHLGWRLMWLLVGPLDSDVRPSCRNLAWHVCVKIGSSYAPARAARGLGWESILQQPPLHERAR